MTIELALAEAETQRRGFSLTRLATHRLPRENLGYYRHQGWTKCGGDGDKIYMHKTIPASGHSGP
ncbi:hypothetical protein [Microbulbifer taiwanensis]|uniref:GNAT family N-acetyltransferase n=1 Tax=Microbulbifer taiwanensis TaxID=986746 RepID=A0ABW1YJ75_9GAMM|nr:hypothetical protein [Microbulbifer taiwanensis]